MQSRRKCHNQKIRLSMWSERFRPDLISVLIVKRLWPDNTLGQFLPCNVQHGTPGTEVIIRCNQGLTHAKTIYNLRPFCISCHTPPCTGSCTGSPFQECSSELQNCTPSHDKFYFAKSQCKRWPTHPVSVNLWARLMGGCQWKMRGKAWMRRCGGGNRGGVVEKRFWYVGGKIQVEGNI